MSIQKISATENTPEIDFDFNENRFRIAGLSYPENVSAFFDPVLEIFQAYLDEASGVKITFQFELVYFNSASAKVFHNLLSMLDDKASQGNDVTIEWAYEEDDDNMEETGEEFAEDIENASFILKKIEIS